MARSENIALVSMPGGGKSTIGRLLARRLRRDFVDSDAVIEHRLGCPVRVFFEKNGEEAFRDIEQQVVAELLDQDAIVLATGGGVVLREANRVALQSGSVVVYLRSTPEDLFRRLRHDTKRPLLQVPDPLAALRKMYSLRDPLYRQVAQYTVDTGRPSVQTLVNMILMQLELAGEVDAAQAPSPIDSPAAD